MKFVLKIIKKKQYINQHIDIVHKGQKPYQCKICQKSFGILGTLQRHNKSVHERLKPHSCQICQKSFG